jgi:hypothetical protein
MRSFVIQTSYTDGFWCERHRLEAENVEAACEKAIAAAGSSKEVWVVTEYGPTAIDEVVEIVGAAEVTHPIPADCATTRNPAVRPRLAATPAQQQELAEALRLMVRDGGEAVPKETLERALAALAAVDGEEGSP